MKLPSLPWFCSVLWLAVPIRAQTDAKATDPMSLKIIQTEQLGFPLQLNNSLVMAGDATVAIRVDRDGRLADCLVTGYSRKEFADSAVASLKVWRFEPPRVNGVPWSSVEEVHFNFSRTGVVVSFSGLEVNMDLVDEMGKGKYVYRSRTLRELDRIPTPVHVVSPVSPALGSGENKRIVAVEFYIDEEGRVRMPTVSRADVDSPFAASALDAVRQWRFEPPLYRGQPTLALVRQQFSFVAKP
jgi:TonB family protein